MPLDQWVAGVGQAEAPPISARLRLFSRICAAVNAAHLRGVIHRDLKLSNIRIDTDGDPHVLDFGLAKLVGGPTEPYELDASDPAVTKTGQFVGSLPWASPEQAQDAGGVDVRTDVYSLFSTTIREPVG